MESTEARRAMAASVSDVAAATSLLLAVCLIVLLTLIAVCRLLRLSVFSPSSSSGCSDGARCRGRRDSFPGGPPTGRRSSEDVAAKLPQDQSGPPDGNQLPYSSRLRRQSSSISHSTQSISSMQTDFTDTRTALRFFLCFGFFLVFSYRYFLPF